MQKKNPEDLVPVAFVQEAQDNLTTALQTDIKYSIEPDPDGSLKFSNDKKTFIKAYLEFRNIPCAAQMSGVSEEKAVEYYWDAQVRSEIRRINLAMYYRKFSKRLLTIDEIGGYLTSLITDEDMLEHEKLKSSEKLQAAKMIIDLNKLKADAYNNPGKIIEYVDIENDVKNMDASKIKELIEKVNNPSKKEVKEHEEINERKEDLIRQINVMGYLDPSEIEYLKTCSEEELQNLINNKKENITNDTD